MTDDNLHMDKLNAKLEEKRKELHTQTDIDKLSINETPSNQSFSKAARISEAEAAVAEVTQKSSPSKKAEVAQKLAEAKNRVQELQDRANPTADQYKIISIHVVAAGETLSSIAQKYYGKATPPYYQYIYEHNLEVIGANINLIIPGQQLVIPELPEDLI